MTDFDTVLANIDIETVRKNGGGSFDREGNPVSFADGFIVQTVDIWEDAHSLDDIWEELPRHFWHPAYEDEMLGFWQNPDNGYWSVGFSTYFPWSNAADACLAAEMNLEKFIYVCEYDLSVETRVLRQIIDGVTD